MKQTKLEQCIASGKAQSFADAGVADLVDPVIDRVLQVLQRNGVDMTKGPGFYLCFAPTEVLGMALGVYSVKHKTIALNSALLADHEALLATLRHELAHHLDFVLSGNTGHSATWRRWARTMDLVDPKATKCASEVSEAVVAQLVKPKRHRVKRYLYSVAGVDMHLTAYWHKKVRSGVRCRNRVGMVIGAENFVGEVVLHA